MTLRIGVAAARARFGQVIEECRGSGEPCILTRRGKPIAVLLAWDDNVSSGELLERASIAAGGAQPSALASPDPHSEMDTSMDSATWGQWEQMNDEDRAAMVLAESLIQRNRVTREPQAATGGWASWAREK